MLNHLLRSFYHSFSSCPFLNFFFKMWSSFVTFFKDSLSYQILEHREPQAPYLVYRDSLKVKNKLKTSSNYKPNPTDLCFASLKPVSPGANDQKNSEKPRRSCPGSVEEKGVIRVKVTMTKQEAARLLSKCKEGGVLGFKDVANELVQIPKNRVNVESLHCASRRGVLKSIPE